MFSSQDASGWYRLLNGNVGRQRHFAVKKQIDLNNSTIGTCPKMNSLFSHSVGLSTRCALLLTVPTDPDMEEDLVVVDDSDLDMNGLNEKEDRSRGTPSPSSAALPTTGSDVDSSSRPEPKGKTPYTTTVKLHRGPKGYGFSVTWTHPPRYVSDDSSIRIDVYFCRTKLDFPNVENWD